MRQGPQLSCSPLGEGVEIRRDLEVRRLDQNEIPKSGEGRRKSGIYFPVGTLHPHKSVVYSRKGTEASGEASREEADDLKITGQLKGPGSPVTKGSTDCTARRRQGIHL